MTPPSRSEGRLIWSPAFRSNKGPLESPNGRIGGGCGGNREAVVRVVGPFLSYFFPHMNGEQGCSYPLWLCRLRRRQRKHRHAIQGIATQGRDDVSSNFGGDSHLCLNRGGSQVWRGNDPLMCEQLPQDHIIADRLLTEDIERHSGQSSLRERSQQRLLVNQVASRAIHQVRTGLEQRQFTGAQELAHPFLLFRERGMQGHEIGTLEHLFLAVECHPDLLRPPGRDQGITGDHLHPECLCLVCHLRAYPSQANDAEHLLV